MHPKFRAIALHESGGHHVAFSKRARIWLDELAGANGFQVDYVQNTGSLDDALMSKYQLFIQLDYPPYSWSEDAAAAFENYIAEGRGGWIGFHHASLLGEFDGYPMWQWFSEFLGGIRYENYIATLARGTVTVEAPAHPVMRGVPASFPIDKEEWYTYDRSPRPNVHVLASVDESTYQPASGITMGDHPVVWTNPNVAARNVYLFMGHSPDLFDDDAYTTLVRNAVFWAAGREDERAP
jgi:type 1 glutamine amidotransferase